MPINLVVPTSLQIGCIELHPYFCTVSETGRYVTEQYIDTPVGSLAPHNFVKLTEVNPEFSGMPKSDILDDPFNYMLEVYMYNYIVLSVPRSQDQLNHVVNAIITGIHDVFPWTNMMIKMQSPSRNSKKGGRMGNY